MEKNKKSIKKILVTGGAGYVGSVLSRMLLDGGYSVRVLDSLRVGGQGLLPYLGDRQFEFIKGDVRDEKVVTNAAKGVDAVVHLAAIVGYPACRKDPELSRSINVDGTRMVAKIVGGKVPIIFASTSSTYGKIIEKFCTETTPLNPLSDYGKQKVEAEDIVQKTKEFVIFRFSTAFGVSPRMRWDLLPHDFTYQAVKEKNLIVYEKNFIRSFVHVRDMNRAIVFALEHYGVMRGNIYNVGDSSLDYTKEAICKLIQKKVDYYLHFADVGHDLEERDFTVSYEKLNALGFKTTVTMEEGVSELIKAAEATDIPNLHYNA